MVLRPASAEKGKFLSISSMTSVLPTLWGVWAPPRPVKQTADLFRGHIVRAFHLMHAYAGAFPWCQGGSFVVGI